MLIYGFGKESLMLLLNYLSNRWQRIKIKTSFSSWTELLQGVQQELVLGPLLFNIYFSSWIVTFVILQMTLHLLFVIKT